MLLLRTKAKALVVLGIVAAITAACSLIVDTKTDQCTSNDDCKSLSSQFAVCQGGVCVTSANDVNNTTDGPIDEAGQNDGGAGDGCVPKIPATQDDFLNEQCTLSSCIPFDNCARVGICDAGLLPDVITPPDGGF